MTNEAIEPAQTDGTSQDTGVATEQHEPKTRGFFAWLPGLFRGRRKPIQSNYDFGSNTFHIFDIDDTAKKLDLEAKAQENAESEIPASDSTALDGPQAEIQSDIKGVMHLTIANQTNKLDFYQDKINGCNLDSSKQKLENWVPTFERETGTDAITISREKWTTAKSELDEFKKKHAITRAADYPVNMVYQRLVVLAILVCEAIMNSYFFIDASDYGLLGGVFLAFICAAVDVGVIAVFCKGAVFVLWKGTWSKIGGVVMCVLIFAWVIAYNLGVAHFRDAAQEAPLTAAQQAWFNLVNNPGGLADVESFILFILGMVLSVFGLQAILRLDESIPWYGGYTRRADEARGKWNDQKVALKTDGEQLYSKTLKDLDLLKSGVDLALLTLKRHIDNKASLVANVRGFIVHGEDACNALMRRYRDDNIRYRKTPAPAYFGEQWAYTGTWDVPSDRATDLQILDREQTAANAFYSQLEAVRNGVGRAYQRFLAQIEE